jgi:hypothetical protein
MAHTGYLFNDIDSHPDVGNFGGWAPNRNWVTMRKRLSQHRINKTPRTASRARDILYLWMTHSFESLLFFVVILFLRWCQFKWRATKVACKNAVSIFFLLRGGTLGWMLPVPFLSSLFLIWIFTLKLSPRFIGSNSWWKSIHADFFLALYYRRPVEAIQNDLGKSITAHDGRWLIDHRALRVRFTWINKRETVRDFLEVCARWIEVKLVIQLLIHKWFCWNQFSQSSIREGGKPFRIRNDGKSRPVVILVWFIRKFRQFSTSPHRVIKLDWTKSRVSNSVRTKLKKESIRI